MDLARTSFSFPPLADTRTRHSKVKATAARGEDWPFAVRAANYRNNKPIPHPPTSYHPLKLTIPTLYPLPCLIYVDSLGLLLLFRHSAKS